MEKQKYVKLPVLVLISIFLSACAVVAQKPAIPVVQGTGGTMPGERYFEAIKFYRDRGLQPFNSLTSVTASLTEKAAADGAQAFIVTKKYEKYATGAINGYYAFVEGWGIRWKAADNETLLADLQYVVEHRGGKPFVQTQKLFSLIQKKKIKAAVPLLREFFLTARVNETSIRHAKSVYIDLAGPEELPHFVKMVESGGRGFQIGLLGLERYGTPEQAPLLLKVIKANARTDVITAAKALRRLKLKRYKEEWKTILRHHSDLRVKTEAAHALIELGERREVESYVRDARDPSIRKRLSDILLQS